MIKGKVIGVAAVVVVSLALFACSSSDDKSDSTATSGSEATSSASTPAAAATAAPTETRAALISTGIASVPPAVGAGSATSVAAASSPASPTTSAAAATTTAPAPAGAPAAQTVEIRAGERGSNDYYFDPKAVTVAAGKVTIKLTDVGPDRPHTFVIRNKNGNGELARINRTEVGQSSTMEVTLEEGTYQFLCGLPGHADRGQTGTFTVTKS